VMVHRPPTSPSGLLHRKASSRQSSSTSPGRLSVDTTVYHHNAARQHGREPSAGMLNESASTLGAFDDDIHHQSQQHSPATSPLRIRGNLGETLTETPPNILLEPIDVGMILEEGRSSLNRSGLRRDEDNTAEKKESGLCDVLLQFGDISTCGLHMDKDEKVMLDIPLVEKAIIVFEKCHRILKSDMMEKPKSLGKLQESVDGAVKDLRLYKEFLERMQVHVRSSVGGYPRQHIDKVTDVFARCKNYRDRLSFLKLRLSARMDIRQIAVKSASAADYKNRN